MAERKPFLLRLDPETFAALQRWSADELRSVNGQVEFVLRRALQEAGRLPARGAGPAPDGPAAVEPAAGEPAAVEPAAGEPAAVEPAAGEPAAGEPRAEVPAVDH